ncbi:MAG: tetratricopeptide repeat protein [Blastocatellia bacterium]|nr:tetratricopeptide repeat protein [Blastocatellia bacterium]
MKQKWSIAVVLGLWLLGSHSLSASAGGQTKPEIHYGDPGFVGTPINFACGGCGLADAIYSIAQRAKVPLKFPGVEKWAYLTQTVNFVNKPWNQALDELLGPGPLKAVWSNNQLLIVPKDAGDTERAPRSEWLPSVPPLPSTVASLAGSGRAKEADRYLREGVDYVQLGTASDALKAMTRFVWALELYEGLKFAGQQAHTLTLLGTLLDDRQNSQSALQAFQEALPLARTANNQRLEFTLSALIAEIHARDESLKAQGLEEATTTYEAIQAAIQENSTKLSRASTTLDRVPEAYAALGSAFLSAGEPKRAVECLQKALIQRASSDSGTSLETLILLSRANEQAGNKTEAQRNLEALKASLKKNPESAAACLQRVRIAKIFRRLGDAGEALKWLQEAQTFLKGANDVNLEIRVNRDLGRVYQQLGQDGEARKAFERALALSQANKDNVTAEQLQEELKKVK